MKNILLGLLAAFVLISPAEAAGTFRTCFAPNICLDDSNTTSAYVLNSAAENSALFFPGTSGGATSSQLAGVISDETGSGSVVFATSPTLVTPTLGAASATSINKLAITAPASSATLAIANGKTFTASNTLTLTGTDSSSVAFGSGGTVVYTGSNLSVFAATTSAQLAGVISDETGTGVLVFNAAPAFTGGISLSGSSTGSISVLPQAAAGTYNFNLPTTAGSSGQVLTSGGGINAPMTWSTAGTGTVTGPGSSTSTALAIWNGVGGATLMNGTVTEDVSGNLASVGTVASGAQTITSASANSLAIGANGATNPVLQIDGSTSSVATGVTIKGAAAAGGVAITAISSGTNEALTINSKGTGNAVLGTGGSSGSVKLQSGGSDRLSVTNSAYTFASGTTGTATTTRWLYTGPADTNLTAGTEAPNVIFDLSGTRNWLSNTTVSAQRNLLVKAPTFTFTSSGGNVTDTCTVCISGAPIGGTNSTLASAEGLEIPTSVLTNTTTGAGAVIAAPSGATNNFSLITTGNVAHRGTIPTISSCGSGAIVTGSSNHKGQIGSITAATACTITFSSALDTAPACTFSDSAGTAVGITSISTAAVTTSMTALTGSLYYICF